MKQRAFNITIQHCTDCKHYTYLGPMITGGPKPLCQHPTEATPLVLPYTHIKGERVATDKIPKNCPILNGHKY